MDHQPVPLHDGPRMLSLPKHDVLYLRYLIFCASNQCRCMMDITTHVKSSKTRRSVPTLPYILCQQPVPLHDGPRMLSLPKHDVLYLRYLIFCASNQCRCMMDITTHVKSSKTRRSVPTLPYILCQQPVPLHDGPRMLSLPKHDVLYLRYLIFCASNQCRCMMDHAC
ncbi:hypothetical protein J6590_020236 [Homalodisca vitripennis]|nr:hypothetical protein J6590_020236 [Homalodisca vitripennis]